MSLERALYFVFAREGGYVNNPHDRGGATNWGITQRNYDNYRASISLDIADIKDLTKGEAITIYTRNYWLVGKCNKIPYNLDIVHFDSCVQHGCGTAAKFLQRALGVKDDGFIGQVTLATLQTSDIGSITADYLDLRDKHYYDIIVNDPSQKIFEKGWANRMRELREFLKES